MYSIYNEGKSVFAEWFIRTLKNKIFRHMTAALKNVYFDILNDIVNKYNNTVHRTMKMKPIDVTTHPYPEYNEDSNEKNPKLKFGDRVRISKYKNIFAKGCTQNSSDEVFIITRIKDTVPWTYWLVNWMVNQLLEVFMKKGLQKTSQEKFRIEKVIKKKVTDYMSNGKDMIII